MGSQGWRLEDERADIVEESTRTPTCFTSHHAQSFKQLADVPCMLERVWCLCLLKPIADMQLMHTSGCLRI
jgi:hypothetical protein